MPHRPKSKEHLFVVVSMGKTSYLLNQFFFRVAFMRFNPMMIISR